MSSPELTKNEEAANGPLAGDLSLYEKELRASESLSTPGYYSFPQRRGNLGRSPERLFPRRLLYRFLRRPQQGLRVAQRGQLSGLPT